jgi:colicin import membrane protein
MTGEDRLPPRREPGKWPSIALAVFVHGALLMLLFFGVRWQTRAPESVAVEIFRAGPATQAVPPPAPRPAPRPEPRHEPVAKPAPKPVVKPAPPPAPKADIAVKEKEKPKPQPKPLPKVEPPPKPKPEPAPKPVPKPKPKPEPDPAPAPNTRADTLRQQKLLEEQLRRDTEQLAQARMQREAEREMAMLREQQAAAAEARGRTEWTDRIRQKIRGNIVVPPGVPGNPEAVFDVSLLPDASVLTVRLRKSSGNSALDAAIERAIRKSSPLPRPEQGAVERELSLKFRPLEE